jgi:peptidoglycan-associated lipoprotein
MRRAPLASAPLFAFLVVLLAGCPAKPKDGECKKSEDCEGQEGYGKVCVEGRCQECARDTDCKAGYVCRGSKCQPRPECEKDADCGSGKTCQGGRCLAPAAAKPECYTDGDCGPGATCKDGKCAAKPTEAAGAGSCDKLDTVRFGFNEHVITPEARATLDHDADCIKKLNAKKVGIAGHADERGTTEYNLTLGEKRAVAVKKYLVNLGIAEKTFKTVSYGKERPVNPGHDESAWAENRRAELGVEK